MMQWVSGMWWSRVTSYAKGFLEDVGRRWKPASEINLEDFMGSWNAGLEEVDYR